jgi:chemotaxis protein CheX
MRPGREPSLRARPLSSRICSRKPITHREGPVPPFEVTMASADGNGKVAPATDWREILGYAATEVFSMMVGAEITLAHQGLPVVANVTGMVGIAGALSAVLSLRCSTQAANKIASQMLGIPVNDAASQSLDAIGEICNMVAGHFKEKIGLGDKCMLSVPTVVSGTDYQLRPIAGRERLDLPILYEEEPVWLTLEIRK